MALAIETLLRKRISLQNALSKVGTYLEGLTAVAPDPIEVNLRLSMVTKYWESFLKVQDNIEAEVDEDSFAAQIQEREDFTEKYVRIYSRLTKIVASLAPPAPTNTSSMQTDPHLFHVRLPELGLPTFDGDYRFWTEFRDIFKVLVHENNNLQDVQRLHYLKSCLRGEPKGLIQSLSTTAGNYAKAWEIIEIRYQNPRRIVGLHFRAILQHPSLIEENPAKLRTLLDTFIENIKALEVQEAATWDNLVVFLLSEKLDPETRRLWEMTLTDTSLPSPEDLHDFLQVRCHALEATTRSKGTQRRPVAVSSKQSHVAQSTSRLCPVCNGAHRIYTCEKFIALQPEGKIDMVQKLKLCFNCLGIGHSLNNCSSPVFCRICRSKHHSLLHKEKREQSQRTNSTVACSAPMVCGAILPTAVVKVRCRRGPSISCRVLLDSGSQTSFISRSMVNRLRTKWTPQTEIITGIGMSANTKAHGKVRVTIISTQSDYQREVDALVLDKITNDLPSFQLNLRNWKFRQTSTLADPHFDQPGRIDMLLGADVFMDVIEGPTDGSSGLPIIETKFGRVIAGGNNQQLAGLQCNFVSSSTSLDQQLQRFWTIDSLPIDEVLTSEEKKCEEHFKSTHRRDETGRYVVGLPFKSHEPLGDSRRQATACLLSMERRFKRDQELHRQYVEFMDDYERQGHMKRCDPAQQGEPTFYLPHHAVLRKDSVSTKLRVVFNASVRTPLDTSLNQQLMVGPTIQDNLHKLLLRFRTYPIALIADIAQMYRQVVVRDEDQTYQRVMWRSSSSVPIEEYKLTTVTYGTACAPFLATRVLRQLAEDEKDAFPMASAILSRDFYVDDCITGGQTVSDARKIQSQLQQLLQRGGFTLRKWASNVPELLMSSQEDVILHLHPESDISTLGLKWHTRYDQLSLSRTDSSEINPTKRSVLSEISKLFDPLGLAAPVIILAKIFMQQLWVAGVGWDDVLDSELHDEWTTIKHSIHRFTDIRVNRFVESFEGADLQLHGFCDSSERAYGAAIYLRCQQGDGRVTSHLLCSKTRVAPIKQINVPRLELCSALLLAQLMKVVEDSLGFELSDIQAWSDSTIALAWIRGEPRRWKTFVGNRVAEIQELVSPARWHHVSGSENPADVLSRGTSTETLSTNELWWHGPPWLLSDVIPTSALIPEPQAVVEARSFVSQVQSTHPDPTAWMERFSSWEKLVAVTAWIRRFLQNSSKRAQLTENHLSSSEINDARLAICRSLQRQSFPKEIDRLSTDRDLPKRSSIASLNPFLQDEVLRVGGRLQNSSLPFAAQHPVILPSDHPVTRLLVKSTHEKLLHGQSTVVLAKLRQRYWIPRARDVIRHTIHRCHRCFRFQRQIEQQMATLPTPRVTEGLRAFLQCGLDYAGPIELKARPGRGRPVKTKAYIALFICMATKAIHLELVGDLTSEACLAALRRFIARRGLPSDIYSDQGTNFKGLAPVLKLTAEAGVRHLASDGVRWHFNPPSAPHFGGLWEAGVKSMKTHLRRTVGNALLSYEESYTLLTQIEACLNSRPLCPLSDDPDSLDYLSPGHFLIGAPLTSVPSEVEPPMMSSIRRWRYLQQQLNHFWHRWSREYLVSLQQRPKWRQTRPNLDVGDMVLIRDENLNPLQWILGRIVETHPGMDGLVRTVTIRTARTIMQRPIVKLCPLPKD